MVRDGRAVVHSVISRWLFDLVVVIMMVMRMVLILVLILLLVGPDVGPDIGPDICPLIGSNNQLIVKDERQLRTSNY